MMVATFVPIESVTLASSAASVTFSAIPQTYTDLVVRCSIRTDYATAYPNDVLLGLNGTDTLYSVTKLYAMVFSNTTYIGSSRVGTNRFEYVANSASSTTNTYSSAEFYIPNYVTSIYKAISGVGATANNSTTNIADVTHAGLWRSTDPITSIVLQADNNFVAGSTFHLYGIKNS